MVLEVEPDAPVGDLATTFTLSSSVTIDTDSCNNEAIIILIVERRADIKISLYVPGDNLSSPTFSLFPCLVYI